jgi:hypothetical protein
MTALFTPELVISRYHVLIKTLIISELLKTLLIPDLLKNPTYQESMTGLAILETMEY